MEEVKFRIWQTCWDDEELQIMHPIKGIDFEKKIYWVTTSSAGYDFKDAILMQWTGLKDKNDIEIYESDIVEYNPSFDPDLDSAEEWNPEIFTVAWTDDCYGHKSGWDLVNKNGECHNYYYGGFNPKACIVIGNIYKNPELAKK